MPENNLVADFEEAYQNLGFQPLITPDDLEKFQVPYREEVTARLKQLVKSCTPNSNKIIFAGHLGSGKTTLLAEFSRQQEDKYFVVFFSISNMIEMSDVNHINILFAIAVQLMEKAETQKVKIEKSIKAKFYEWFATRTQTKVDEVKAESSAGFDLLGIIKGKLQADAVTRTEIKEELGKNFADLIGRINEIAVAIENSVGKDILVIIDDLDKLDLALVGNIYRDNIKALLSPQFRVVFTIPIAVVRNINLRSTISTETDNKIQIMPVSKLFAKGENRQLNPIALEQTNLLFLDILQKRLSSKLIEPEIAQQIVFKSGGVLREMIRIANKCCEECLLLIEEKPSRQDIKINQEILNRSLTELRLEFTAGLGKVEFEILTATYNNYEPDDSNNTSFLDLLHGLYVLEYRNDDLWYDIHPIVCDLLKRRGLI